jgi:hypothetical protein
MHLLPRTRKQTMVAGVGDTEGHDPSDPATSCSCRQPIDEARSIFVGTASDSGFLLAACLSRNNYPARMRFSYPSRERVRRGMLLQALLKETKQFFPLASLGVLTERHNSW